MCVKALKAAGISKPVVCVGICNESGVYEWCEGLVKAIRDPKQPSH